MKPDIWEVAKQADGSFEILHQGELLLGSIPEKWLEAELGRCGFCGQEYDDIRRQLDQCGKARITL